jgi:hypothetical protein
MGVLPGDSGPTITHITQNNTPYSNNVGDCDMRSLWLGMITQEINAKF